MKTSDLGPIHSFDAGDGHIDKPYAHQGVPNQAVPFTDYQDQVKRWADGQEEPLNELPYAMRNNKKTLTALQYKILKESVKRSGYTATSPRKLTRKGIEEAILTYATTKEMEMLVAEQEGKTEPKFWSKSQGSETSASDPEIVPAEVDRGISFLHELKKKISPDRAAMEEARRIAINTKNNGALRAENRRNCYPCFRRKEACNVDKKTEPDMICHKCEYRQEVRTKAIFDAELCCRRLPEEIPRDALQRWLGNKMDGDGWQLQKQIQRGRIKQGRRTKVGTTDVAKQDKKTRAGK